MSANAPDTLNELGGRTGLKDQHVFFMFAFKINADFDGRCAYSDWQA
jgi:hypothetical protein